MDSSDTLHTPIARERAVDPAALVLGGTMVVDLTDATGSDIAVDDVVEPPIPS